MTVLSGFALARHPGMDAGIHRPRKAVTEGMTMNSDTTVDGYP